MINKLFNKIKSLASEETGFTLIEMVVVVTVIGMLMSIAVPTLSSVVDKTNTAVLKSDLHNIMHSMELYYLENQDYPDSVSDGSIADIEDSLTNLNISNGASDYSYITDNSTNPNNYYISYKTADNKYYYLSSIDGGIVGPEDTAPSFDTGGW